MPATTFACEILEIGTQADPTDSVNLKLHEVGGQGGWTDWCQAADSMKREMLAAGLTAFTMETRVVVFMDKANNVILRLNVLRR